ncbi:hypothetical protein SAMN05660293_02106 [Dyadobacter psychrophilus]|uniref:Uncharacterized protein n=1 Tax=Dyadobacter psychrophilus TaxID=651661 RepID=A0A1T5E1S4_9BACT|nr:hypothetical protein SAMN05660293_02106 [Dyadobacter psychrophilus]
MIEENLLRRALSSQKSYGVMARETCRDYIMINQRIDRSDFWFNYHLETTGHENLLFMDAYNVHPFFVM